MHAHLATAVFAVLVTSAAISDVRRRRIANIVTVPLAVSGLVARAIASGASGFSDGLLAAALVGALLWIPWTRSFIGGGDLKFASGAAVWVGTGLLPQYVLTAAVVAGVAGIAAYVASTRAARSEMHSNLRTVVAGRPASIPMRGGGGRVSVPAGAAFAVAALFAVLMGG
jgi:prepilin peptidase CpaA